MILIDANEDVEYDYLLGQMGIETQRGNYNQSPGTTIAWPDFIVVADSQVVGVNNKNAVEAMANLDAVEEQLSRELKQCEKLVFMYRGFVAPHPDGTYAGDLTRIITKSGRGGAEYEELISRGRVIHQPYQRWLSFVWKCQDVGIPVVPTGTVQGSAMFLSRLHASPANTLFTRLIDTRARILATDQALQDRAQWWMGVTAVGPEAALCLGAEFDSSWELHEYLANGGSLAEFRLPNGRRFGKALDAKVRDYLGVPTLVTA